MAKMQESFTFTVGKLDAGMAILLGERAHLIEFPSILLPPGATAGSIVNIAVHQNFAEEKRRDEEFWDLQNDILATYGSVSPENPKLELRNVTQTSVTLEWPPIELATSRIRSLDIYRNGQRLAAIPSPLTNTSTKLSGLSLDTDYSFQLILRTSAGTFPSNIIRVRTHTMTDTSGISVCFGNVQDDVLLENAKLALREMKAKWSDKIQIDTTHFVCTTPAATPNGVQASGGSAGAPGVEYQRALQLSIPVVQPNWILACHSEKKMVPIASFYLGATPSAPINSAPFTRPQSMSQASLPHSPSNSATNNKTASSHRASMPAPARATSVSPPSAASGPSSSTQPPKSPETKARTTAPPFEPTPEENEDEDERAHQISQAQRKRRSGTMNKDFRFPQSPSEISIGAPEVLATRTNAVTPAQGREDMEDVNLSTVASGVPTSTVIAPSSVEVPPPPPVEKERGSIHTDAGDADDDVGMTEEIDLN